jgi:hypothetical protein
MATNKKWAKRPPYEKKMPAKNWQGNKPVNYNEFIPPGKWI